MKKFKELQIGEVFRVDNLSEIVSNRGDVYNRLDDMRLHPASCIRFQKRDELGANSIYHEKSHYVNDPGCYYRIDPDNLVY